MFSGFAKINLYSSYKGTAMFSLYIESALDVIKAAFIPFGIMDEVTNKRDNSNTTYSTRHE